MSWRTKLREFAMQAAFMSLFVAIDQTVRTIVNEKIKKHFHSNSSNTDTTLNG